MVCALRVEEASGLASRRGSVMERSGRSSYADICREDDEEYARVLMIPVGWGCNADDEVGAYARVLMVPVGWGCNDDEGGTNADT